MDNFDDLGNLGLSFELYTPKESTQNSHYFDCLTRELFILYRDIYVQSQIPNKNTDETIKESGDIYEPMKEPIVKLIKLVEYSLYIDEIDNQHKLGIVCYFPTEHLSKFCELDVFKDVNPAQSPQLMALAQKLCQLVEIHSKLEYECIRYEISSVTYTEFIHDYVLAHAARRFAVDNTWYSDINKKLQADAKVDCDVIDYQNNNILHSLQKQANIQISSEITWDAKSLFDKDILDRVETILSKTCKPDAQTQALLDVCKKFATYSKKQNQENKKKGTKPAQTRKLSKEDLQRLKTIEF